MKRINVIVKPTDACNLRCKYCYNSSSHYSNEILSLERFAKLLKLLSASCDCISLIWHGGEPMMCGLEYFQKVMELEEESFQNTNIPIENSIQTNGTLIDKHWISFFKKHSFKVGISFDGIHNESYRQQSEKTLQAIGLMQKEKVPFGCIAVVADDNYDLLENYRYFAEKQLHFTFSPMFAEGNAVSLQPLSVEKYTEQCIQLFDHWLYDKSGVNIRLFSDCISMLLGSHTRTCSHGSCLGKWLSISADGVLSNCGRDTMKQFAFGTIDEMDDIAEAYHSDGFRQLLVGSIARRKKCMESCPYFKYCEGGCTDIAILEGDISTPPAFNCFSFQKIFSHIEGKITQLMEEKVPLSELNPSMRIITIRCLADKKEE